MIMRRALSKYASKLNISFWSASNKLYEDPEKAFAIRGEHLSPLGHKILYEGIKKLVN